VAFLGIGCVSRAVLENDVRSAEWRARTLSTASDLKLAEAALSAQLVEREALYQRTPDDERVRRLLQAGYGLMARGFIEAERLEALGADDSAGVARATERQTDALSRAEFYGAGLAPQPAQDPGARLVQALSGAERACQTHARAAYEAELMQRVRDARGASAAPEARLERALLRRLANAWLTPNVAQRCGFSG
jgi:hypothetical protein